MDIPAQLEINNKVYEYANLNRYQKQIYIELVRQIKTQQTMKPNTLESIRQEGVIGFLYGRLEQYDGLDYITNIYAQDQITPADHLKRNG